MGAEANQLPQNNGELDTKKNGELGTKKHRGIDQNKLNWWTKFFSKLVCYTLSQIVS